MPGADRFGGASISRGVFQVRISRSRSSNAAIQFNKPPVTEASPEGVFNVPNRRVTDLDGEVRVEWIDDDVDRGYMRPDFGGALQWAFCSASLASISCQ